MVCVELGLWMAGMAFHTDSAKTAAIWLAAAVLLGECGPLVILVVAARREEM